MNAAFLFTSFLAAALFGVLAPFAADRLPPRQATWLLSVGSGLAALAGTAVLGLLASVWLAELPAVAGKAHWSAATLERFEPVDDRVAALAVLVLAASAAAALLTAGTKAGALAASHRRCRRMSAAAGGLVVVDDAEAGAIALPGRPGRIVVSSSLLILLTAPERRALLAHERAHLVHAHHLHRSVVAVASAANPCLLALRSTVVRTTERWADEDAAFEVGDRRRVASALIRSALIASRAPAAALLAAANDVPLRVAALLEGERQCRPAAAAAAALLLIVAGAAVLLAGRDTDHLFDLAASAYAGAPGR